MGSGSQAWGVTEHMFLNRVKHELATWVRSSRALTNIQGLGFTFMTFMEFVLNM